MDDKIVRTKEEVSDKLLIYRARENTPSAVKATVLQKALNNEDDRIIRAYIDPLDEYNIVFAEEAYTWLIGETDSM